MEKTYEEIMKDMMSLPEAERAAKMAEATKICRDFCGRCPSYKGTGETALLFCANGKSSIIKDERGCICGGCPVQKNMALRWRYYCTRGSGREQAGM